MARVETARMWLEPLDQDRHAEDFHDLNKKLVKEAEPSRRWPPTDVQSRIKLGAASDPNNPWVSNYGLIQKSDNPQSPRANSGNYGARTRLSSPISAASPTHGPYIYPQVRDFNTHPRMIGVIGITGDYQLPAPAPDTDLSTIDLRGWGERYVLGPDGRPAMPVAPQWRRPKDPTGPFAIPKDPRAPIFPELWLSILPELWRKGLAREALFTFMRLYWEGKCSTQAPIIVARTTARDHAVEALLRHHNARRWTVVKNGMEIGHDSGVWVDVIVWIIPRPIG